MRFIIRNNIYTKLILTTIVCCSIGIIYFFFFSSRVQIEVYNKTNFDIDSLNIDNKFYRIPKRKSLVIECRELSIQDNLPFGTPKAVLNNMQRDTITYFLCSTGVEKIKSGKYKFDIEAFIGKDYYSLNWTEHK